MKPETVLFKISKFGLFPKLAFFFLMVCSPSYLSFVSFESHRADAIFQLYATRQRLLFFLVFIFVVLVSYHPPRSSEALSGWSLSFFLFFVLLPRCGDGGVCCGAW